MNNPVLSRAEAPHASHRNSLTMSNYKYDERKVDQMLHQWLRKIFRERCLGSSSQIKEFLRAPEHTQQNSIIDLILEQKPTVYKLLPVEVLRQLSLLWIAVLVGYYKSAELLVRSGADVDELFGFRDGNQVIDARWTVLHLLIEMNPIPERLIRLVVDHGADLQARDFEGRTVLHLAVEGDQVQMAEMLLEKGADVQARGFRRRTALHLAATDGRVRMVEMLLEKGAEVNVADRDGVTPLFEVASSSKAAELVPLLMRHGADVFAKDDIGRNVFYPLSRAPLEHVDLARLFIEMGVSPNVTDRILFEPIHLAIRAGHNELVKLYLDHGIDVNALARKDCSLLHIAAAASKPAVLETLLERGSKVNQRRLTDGRTPLHQACKNAFSEQRDNSQVESVRLLLSAGADVLVEDCNRDTPFALSVSRYRYSDDISGIRLKTSIRLMLEALALKKACQPSIVLKDERIIEQYSKLSDYYRDCIEEIEMTKSTRFIETCTYFDLLTKCHCHIAALMRNLEFEIKFNNGLSEFPMYAEDLSRAFKRARNHHQFMLEQEDVISEGVDGILPYLVVRRVAHYILNCCENMK